MERTGKELNLDGNRIINLKDPHDDQDAATKRYADSFVWRIHMLNPMSTRGEYIHTINKKYLTMANLAPLMKITTDMALTSSYSTLDDPHFWLEGLCASNRLWLSKQDLKNKHITVSYRFPINVDAWKLRLHYAKYQKHTIKFHWEVSHDGENWQEKSGSIETETDEEKWNGNTHEINFINDQIAYDWFFWRVVFDEGTLASPWINLLLMKIHNN